MIGLTIIRDLNFRQWLAARPGLWLEVGAVDDSISLLALLLERRLLGLPPIAALRVAPSRRRPSRKTAPPPRPTSANSLSGGHP
ncbi:hypothetical protein [Polymorphobacter megasporae]|uniref:hypothetical protein n=1 Tax=Glacieibacterium megasporae TaxID=2835787 RepID=UPI001C1E1E48|nr:hypothetical protein [Polymorphobacter megasporae]UAJ12389.1 hypothetical protein KTC28_21495 [Polymorphobacter megasporae]